MLNIGVVLALVVWGTLGAVFHNGCTSLCFHQQHEVSPLSRSLAVFLKKCHSDWSKMVSQHLYFGSKTQLSIFFYCICGWIQNDFQFYLWKEKPLQKKWVLFGITNNTNFKMLKYFCFCLILWNDQLPIQTSSNISADPCLLSQKSNNACFKFKQQNKKVSIDENTLLQNSRNAMDLSI